MKYWRVFSKEGLMDLPLTLFSVLYTYIIKNIN